MAQAEQTRADLERGNPGLKVEIVPVVTSGDRGNREALGAFVREIQQQLLDRQIDLALHCLKDLPTQPVPGLQIAAYLRRDDPREAMISRAGDWKGLSPGAIIGTGSLRRSAQIRAQRRDFEFRPLVGNVDTRLRKLQEGEYDAIMLAIAGIRRLGIYGSWRESAFGGLEIELIPTSEVMPAPGQAILVLEGLEEDAARRLLAAALNDVDTERCALAERAFLGRFGTGCSLPIAAIAEVQDGTIELRGRCSSPDGSHVVEGSLAGEPEDAARLGFDLAQELKSRGAERLIALEVGV